MRHHTIKAPADRVHDEVVELLDSIGSFIDLLMPEGYTWTLFVDPGEKELKYWSGTMTDDEFNKMLNTRVGKILAAENPAWGEWFKAGPPGVQKEVKS